MSDRILIRGATVLTQDDALGELPRADILVEGDTIAEVGPNLSAGRPGAHRIASGPAPFRRRFAAIRRKPFGRLERLS